VSVVTAIVFAQRHRHRDFWKWLRCQLDAATAAAKARPLQFTAAPLPSAIRRMANPARESSNWNTGARKGYGLLRFVRRIPPGRRWDTDGPGWHCFAGWRSRIVSWWEKTSMTHQGDRTCRGWEPWGGVAGLRFWPVCIRPDGGPREQCLKVVAATGHGRAAVGDDGPGRQYRPEPHSPESFPLIRHLESMAATTKLPQQGANFCQQAPRAASLLPFSRGPLLADGSPAYTRAPHPRPPAAGQKGLGTERNSGGDLWEVAVAPGRTSPGPECAGGPAAIRWARSCCPPPPARPLFFLPITSGRLDLRALRGGLRFARVGKNPQSHSKSRDPTGSS